MDWLGFWDLEETALLKRVAFLEARSRGGELPGVYMTCHLISRGVERVSERGVLDSRQQRLRWSECWSSWYPLCRDRILREAWLVGRMFDCMILSNE